MEISGKRLATGLLLAVTCIATSTGTRWTFKECKSKLLFLRSCEYEMNEL